MRLLMLAILLSGSLWAGGDRHVLLNATGSQFRGDKQLHFICGVALGNFGWAVAHDLHWEHPERYGMLLALLVGLLKEFRDYRQPHGTADAMDLGYTLAGGSLVTLYSVRW